MKYYKDQEDMLYVDPIVKNHIGLVEITEEEFNTLIQPSQETVILTNQSNAKATRTEVSNSDIEVFGVMWQVGDVDRVNINEAISYSENNGLPDETTQSWILADNTTRDTTKLDLIEVLNEYTERKQRVFEAYITWREGDMLSVFEYVEGV